MRQARSTSLSEKETGMSFLPNREGAEQKRKKKTKEKKRKEKKRKEKKRTRKDGKEEGRITAEHPFGLTLALLRADLHGRP